MQQQSVTHSTFAIERTYAASPQRVFAAFADPATKRRWFAGGEGSGVLRFELDFRVGGFERTRSRTPADGPLKGATLGNDTTFHDIVPDRRIVFAYTMSIGERRISASLATIELLAGDKETQLIFTEQAAFFEGSDGAQMREQGWAQLLDALGKELAR